MEYLIRQNVPMRTAHETVGSLVALCEQKKCRLNDLSLEELQAACDKIEEGVRKVLGTKNAVASLQSYGSGGRGPVEAQLAQWQTRLGIK
jgi:argininosuccinate lyase